MKRIIAAFLCGLLLASGIMVQAAETRAAGCGLSLNFDGTTAICEATCRGNTASDRVSATITLYRGSTYIDSWSGTGTYLATVSGQCSVTRGSSYTLKINYTINGVAQPEQSVTKVCR